MRNVSLVKLLPVFITKPTQFSHRTVQLTAGIYYLLDQQKQQIEAVIRDKSPMRFESKRRQAETSYEEKITTSREPFILTEKKLRIIPTSLLRPTYLVKTVTSWRILCKKLLLMLNRKLYHCVNLHLSAKKQKQSERLCSLLIVQSIGISLYILDSKQANTNCRFF